MKRMFVLMLVLSLALPVLGLAAEATAPDTTPLALGAQRGRRWNTTPADPAAPQSNYVDENNDGLCDNCGTAQGTNPDAPGFVDADKDGVCDNLGTAQQYQGRMGQRGRRGMQARGRGFVDADGDGVCDNLGDAQRFGGRRGRGKMQPGMCCQAQPGAGQMQPGGGRNRR